MPLMHSFFQAYDDITVLSNLGDLAPPLAAYLGEEALTQFDISDPKPAGSASERVVTGRLSVRIGHWQALIMENKTI